MSLSSSQIEREVEASRANVEETVEALKGKMSMGQIFDEATRYLGDTGGAEMASTLIAQIRSNPLPVALVGVGLAWLMSGRGQPRLSRDRYRGNEHDGNYDTLDEDTYRRTFGEAAVYAGSSHPDYSRKSTGMYETWNEGEDSSSGGGRPGGAGDTVRRGARGVRDAAAGAAGGIGSAASGIASGLASAASGVASGVGAVASGVGAVASGLSSAVSGVGSAASQVGRSAYSAAESVADGTRSGAAYAWRGGSSAYRGASNLGSGAYLGASRVGRGARRTFSDVLESEPLVLAALGLAAGAAIGALLPRTEYEDRYLGETRDRLREDAERYAREQFERGKAVAEEAYRTAKAEAEAQGLTTLGEDSVAGRIGEVARATVERVKEKAAEEGLTLGSSEGGQSSAGSRDSSL